MVAPSGQAVVALLTRAPAAGGKTRLFRQLGCDPAPGLLLALLTDTLEAVTASGLPVVVFCEPPEACEGLCADLPDGIRVEPQAPGGLGERMGAAFETLLAAGAARVLLVGSDLPLLDPALLGAADSALASDAADIAISPSTDGGYALIAARRTPWPLFRGITWSRPDVLDRTLDAASAAGLRVTRLPATQDVDTVADLGAVCQAPSGAPRTKAWVRAHPDFRL